MWLKSLKLIKNQDETLVFKMAHYSESWLDHEGSPQKWGGSGWLKQHLLPGLIYFSTIPCETSPSSYPCVCSQRSHSVPLPSTATTMALLFHQCVAKPGGSWTDRKVAFKRDWLVSGDTKSLDHKQCLMFDLHLSVKWKCRDTWKNILFDSWVGWNISHSVVISDPIPSSYTFKRKRQKKKKTWLIFGVKSSTLPLTHGYERQGSVPCLTCL